PASYRAWMKRFGPGELNGWPNLGSIIPLPGRSSSGFECDNAILGILCHDHQDYLPNHAWLSTLVAFAGSGGGDLYVWDPAAITQEEPREYRFYYLERSQEDAPVAAGDSFWQFVEWTENEGRVIENEDGAPGTVFEPESFRAKEKPHHLKVHAW